MTDTHNNTIRYSYFNDQGEIYPETVDYQANHLVFNRESRTDNPTLYRPNFAVTTAYRLSGIDVYSNWNGTTGVLNRRYVFGYCGTTGVACAVSNTGRSLLGKITPFGSDGASALPPITLGFQNVAADWTTPTWAGFSPTTPIGSQCFSGDLDGNGKTDTWCETASGSGTWDVRLSTGSGWTQQSWSGPAIPFPVGNPCFTGDLDGNGKIDFWCEAASGGGTWDVYLSTGTSWTHGVWPGSSPAFPVSNQCFTGDLDGDGKSDFWCQTGSATGSWDVRLSTGSGWSAPTPWSGPAPALPVGNQCLTGDLNGDGRTDFWCESGSGSGSWNVALSTGTSWSTPSPWSGFSSPLPVGDHCFTGDLNGDGKTDFWCQTRERTFWWSVNLSTGIGWSSGLWAGPPVELPVKNQCLTGDLDGDGKSDFWCETTGGNWDIRLSTGSGWTARPLTGLSVTTDTDTKTLKVSAGWNHTCALLSDGIVRCWGRNDSGQLGNERTDTSFAPMRASGISTAVAVSAGGGHTCALLLDSTIRCWGNSSVGQLGNGSFSNSSTPVIVNGINTAVAVSARNGHTCAVLSNGTIRCWGYNPFGQLGNGSSSNSSTPVIVSGINTAVAVSAGWYHTCAVLSNGTVRCWGQNNFGELGNGSTTWSSTPVGVTGISTAVAVSAGDGHTCAVLSDRTVRCWGYNGNGELGNGSSNNSSIPVMVSGINTAVAVSAGQDHACALLSDGTVRCWGQNDSGELGNGSSNNSSIPVMVSGINTAVAVSAGTSHTCAVLSDGTARCWGANGYGKLGNGSTGSSSTPVIVSGIPTSSADSRCFTGELKGDGKVDFWCYQSNGNWGVTLMNTGMSDLLTGISNGIGGHTSITYKSSSEDWTSTDTGWNFPLVNQNVASLSICDNHNGSGCVAGANTSTTSYNYAGAYFNAPDRESRGYASVKATNTANNNTTETFYHQGNGVTVAADSGGDPEGFTAGRPYRIIVNDNTGVTRSKKEFLYAPDENGVPYFTPLQQENSWFCDTATACKQTESIFTYDPANGNLTREDHKGDLSTASDDRTITRNFSPNTTAWILGLPTREIIYRGIGTAPADRMAQTDFYYDESTSCSVSLTSHTPAPPTKGDLTTVVRWLNVGGASPETQMVYDAYGNLTCTRDANGNATSISYDTSATFPKIVTNALGHQTTTQYYGVDGVAADNGLYGQVKSVTDPNGKVTTTTYDKFGRKIQVSFPDGASTAWNYPCVAATGCAPDATNLFGTIGSQYVKTTTAGLSSWVYFDGLGRTVREKRSGPDNKLIRVDTDYNNLGQIESKSLPYFEGAGTNGSTIFTYDVLGRQQQITHPDHTAQNPVRTRFCYSLWSVGTIDPKNHLRWETKDAYGRLRNVYEFTGTYTACPTSDPTAAAYTNTAYQYDVLGNLLYVTDATGRITSIQYDSLSRKISMNDPDVGNVSYTYDGVGNLKTQTDAKGEVITFGYDALNRVRTKTTPGNSDTVPPTSPSGLTAGAISVGQINLAWTASTDNVGVHHYEIERKFNNGPYVLIASPTTTNFSDSTVAAGTAYLYRVRAVDAAGNASGYSNVDLATTVLFTDDPLVAGSTLVKAQHLTELRQAVNAVRATAGLSSAVWTDSTLSGIFIKAVHLQELRSNLNTALTQLGFAAPTYTDPTLTAGSILVKKVHIEELRQAVK